MQKILSGDWENLKIPNWLLENHMVLVSNIFDIKVLKNYAIYHDCGKHLVKEIDGTGLVHYPNHANASADYYCKHTTRNTKEEKLIRNDMFFHTCSAKELEETELSVQELSTLLLTSLAEVHANAEMFGGLDSISFKSKWKQIDRRGKKFCKDFLGEGYKGYTYTFVRQDLPDPQKAVQAGHAFVESQRKFQPQKHTSSIYLRVKNEKKLKLVIKELIDNDINFVLFRDDLFNEEITAVSTEPLFDQDKRSLLKRYMLL